MTCEKMNTKVRLVRCPKCQLVLPELPEISVYKCGGCNTVLQAKNRKPDIKEADQNHEADENGIKQADSVSNFTLSNENSAISTLDESSSSPSASRMNDNVSDENMNTKQPQDEDSSLSLERIEHDKDNTVSIPDSGQFGNDFPTSTELTSNEMEDSSIELQNILGTENDTDQYTEADETTRAKTKRGYFESCNFSDDVCSGMLDSSPESITHEGKSSKKDCILDSNESSPDLEHLQAEDSSDHHLPVVETTSELRAKDPDFTKSPTRSYYDCDQVPNRSSKPPRRKLKPSNVPLKRAESGSPSLLSSETEMRYQRYNKSRLDDDDDVMSSESKMQHLRRKATFIEANNKDNITRVPSYHYERRDSGFFRPDAALYNVPDKLELLKMINELKDELNRTRISNPSFPARFSVEENQHTWPCHHQSGPADAIYAPRISRMAYSGEATDYNCRANCTCFPPTRHYSGGVPLHGMCTYKSHCLAHNDHHQFLQEHETKSKNVRQIPTEKDRSSKRYARSEAGGIPVLSCYHCFELLQFPADFLLSCRKCHRLRCNTCRKTMKFSLENGRHLVPYIPYDTVAPPPSMVDDYTQTSLPHPNIHSTLKPSSFSDEYSTSIDRSSSITRAPHETLKHGNMNKRNLTFGPFEPSNDHHHTRRKNSMETVRRTGKQNDLKEVPSTSGGGAYRALHRLMGYSSPSQVIRR